MSLVINESKAKKAVKALFKHELAKNQDSIRNVWLTINVFEPVDQSKSNPTRILLKHSIQAPGTQRCLFTKDPTKPVKDLLISKHIKGIHKVIGLTKLKKDYPTPEKRKLLMEQYGEFVADLRVMDKMPKLLGKDVYKKRREPLPLDLKKKDIQKEVIRAVKSTFMDFHTGSCYSVKIASTMLNETQALENLLGCISNIVKETEGGAENIRSLMIKTADSLSLPVYEAEEEEGVVYEDTDEEDE
ncbi:ribosomal protein L1/ribosomal biogenesis protein [Phycomyces blakesleeanus]|uniref:Ribosomal protein L1 n=2 Tax=Phycomyces blakesleeanus TaxID=4837 RepID=A0A162ZTC4_PHYB8|nr:hypothetical protein PHYBLDRAFT_182997 [Phycomyces blakesleeanus NRRL 1555(-)]OAD68891.1 hypothetical protein PHYBLDRAFT_182997 [Phycomyces blakesleeanus NRRL 1555(-)]|eukprot:XP_018286931.1 hypothetical protein PHYBLDRAFT_182997 [Phycomyces blakesleeanus NRRL 1555(-)]